MLAKNRTCRPYLSNLKFSGNFVICFNILVYGVQILILLLTYERHTGQIREDSSLLSPHALHLQPSTLVIIQIIFHLFPFNFLQNTFHSHDHHEIMLRESCIFSYQMLDILIIFRGLIFTL